MRTINQQIMNEVFEVIDEIPMSREAIKIPLGMVGEGKVEKSFDGKIEITLPDTDDLKPFLSGLKAKLAEFGEM